MSFNLNLFVAAAVAFSATAHAQTAPSTQTMPPDEPGQGPTASPSAQTGPTTAAQTAQGTSAITAATAADVTAGAPVYDQSGGLIGKVDSASASGVIVNTGVVRAQIPLASFGKNSKGLVIGTTKADLDAAAKKAAKPK
jgi:hypothetical protein